MGNNWCVYCHTTPSGKKYVGITSLKPSQRWKNGSGYKESSYFYKAIKKYGWENIKHDIIFAGLSKSEAIRLEIEYIAKYKTRDKRFGYNMTDGGEGHLGVPMTEENKEKIRLLMTGKPKSESTKEKLRIANTGKQWSEEQKKRRSMQYSGQGNPNFGKHCSEETKEKISAANKGKVISEENKKLISEMFSKPIYCVELGEVFSSREKLAEKIGCHPSTITQAVRGHHGKPPTYKIKGFHVTEEIPNG